MPQSSTTPTSTGAKHQPPRSAADRFELYQVIIHCRDEAQQRELFERLRREGLRCRVTVL